MLKRLIVIFVMGASSMLMAACSDIGSGTGSGNTVNGSGNVRSDAITTTSRALTCAAPHGYIRRFIDEGPSMLALLREVRDLGVETAYVGELLAAFAQTSAASDEEDRAGNVLPSIAHASVQMVGSEPLSERELEVLRLIAGGKSNADVAQTLVIAVSTVKTHTNSIFSKLSVSSRTQAIAEACDLHLI